MSNSVPSQPTVSISPSSPTSQQSLSCSASGSVDADNDTISYAYGWSVGSSFYGFGSSVPLSATSAGETWTCAVVPSDGIGVGPGASAYVVIACTPTTWYRDADGDGWGTTSLTQQSCTQPSGYIAQAGDCSDFNAAVNPGASEICDNVDSNCNGMGDEPPGTVWYWDSDGDGWGTNNWLQDCFPVSNYRVTQSGDCNDSYTWINPNASEICGNGLDENCNNQVDENCPWCGDGICNGTEECMEGDCVSDCCLEYEDFSTSTSWYSTPWYMPASSIGIDEVFVNDVPSYATGTARSTGDYLTHDSNYFGNPIYGSGIGTVYVRFSSTPPGTPVTLRIKYRCMVGGHNIFFTGSNGGQTSYSCSTSWQERSVFTSASILSSGYWAVTIGDGLTEDIIDIDFIGIE